MIAMTASAGGPLARSFKRPMPGLTVDVAATPGGTFIDEASSPSWPTWRWKEKAPRLM